MDVTDPPPEALLIEHRRNGLPGKQGTVSKVAKHAEISEGRWRQIVKGYQQANKETRLRVVAPAGTLARMAAAVSATPEELEQAGRGDAAEELRKLQQVPQFNAERIAADMRDNPLAELPEPHAATHAAVVELLRAAHELTAMAQRVENAAVAIGSQHFGGGNNFMKSVQLLGSGPVRGAVSSDQLQPWPPPHHDSGEQPGMIGDEDSDQRDDRSG